MKLLIVTQYFWPETFIINDFAERLARGGHDVTVFTGKPNYPEGTIYNGYEAAGVTSEELPSGVHIHRVPLRPRGSSGTLNLALNYLSFLFSGLLRFPRIARGHSFDAILFFGPSPMTSAITAIPLKYLKRAHLAIWVQDLWPESLSATGYVSNRVILLMIRQVVRLIYLVADTLLIQSKAFFDPVAALANPRKIVYAPNFSPAAKATNPHDETALPDTLRQTLESHFCIVFAGNLGTAQSLDTILDAAETVADIPDIRIILAGSGSLSAWLEQQIEERALEHVMLTGRLPPASMHELYRRAEGLLVALRDQEIFSYTVPSKVQGYLAAGKPILAAINGETVTILQESGAGYTSPAENSKALADNIRKLYHSPLEERAAMGRRGYAYFRENFEMDAQIEKMVELLEQRMDTQQG